MGAIKEVQDFWHSLSKPVKVMILSIFLIACSVIIVFFSIVCWKAIKGDHVKIVGIEINDVQSKPDTSKKSSEVPQTSKSTEIKDTLKKSIQQWKDKPHDPKYIGHNPLKKNDTTKSYLPREIHIAPAGQNGVSIQGNGNHVVAGTGNNVGVNGDLYINAEKTLTPSGLAMVNKSVDSIRTLYKLPKVINIMMYPYCNAPNMVHQLVEYFNNNGYEATGGGTVLDAGPMIVGFSYDRVGSPFLAIEVNVGRFN